MDEYIEHGYRYSTRYALTKDGERIEFSSEKEACDFLGVKKCSVSSCYRRGSKCKGYEIEKIGLSTHGETKTRLHRIWCAMRERCESASHMHYENYGGRGISVCEEWNHDFVAFRDWAMSHGYQDGLTIDRIDVDGDYCPENCRWASVKEQQNNKRSNHIMRLNGVEHTISEWSEILGIKKTTIKERLNIGWSDEEALTVPVRKRKRGYRPSASYGAKMDGEE